MTPAETEVESSGLVVLLGEVLEERVLVLLPHPELKAKNASITTPNAEKNILRFMTYRLTFVGIWVIILQKKIVK